MKRGRGMESIMAKSRGFTEGHNRVVIKVSLKGHLKIDLRR